MLIDRIKKNEGFSERIYKDTLGFDTIGYGFRVDFLNLNDIGINGGVIEPMKREAADVILELKLKKIKGQVLEHLPWIRGYPQDIKEMVYEMVYQMGLREVLKFKRTLKHLERGEFRKAYEAGMDSLWAKQTPNRAKEVLKCLIS